MFRSWLAGLALAASIAPAASAGPVRVSILGYDAAGLIDTSQSIPDNFDGGVIRLGTTPLPRASAVASAGHSYQQSIDSGFNLTLSFSRPGVTGPSRRPEVTLSGAAEGLIAGSFGHPRLAGQFAGTAQSATLATNPAASGIAPSLLDVFLDPSRVHILSQVVARGNRDYLTTDLVIDPPATIQAQSLAPSPAVAAEMLAAPTATATVPEPSALALLLTASAWLALRRRA